MYNNNKTNIIHFTERTIGEIGISDEDILELSPWKSPKIDWVPLPLTCGDVYNWIDSTPRKCFLDLVSRLEICGPDEAFEIFKLIRHDTDRNSFD